MNKKLLNATIASAVAAAVVVPVAGDVSANETLAEFDKLGLKAKDGTVILVNFDDYVSIYAAFALEESLDANLQSLMDKLDLEENGPTVDYIVYGDKAIKFDTYVELYANDFDNGEEPKITLSEIEGAVEAELPDNSTDYQNGEYLPVNPDETPEENLNETFFYNLAA